MLLTIAVRDDVRGIARDAELLAREGDTAEALRAFVDAGDRAVSLKFFGYAGRCYRAALELDLLRREPIARIRKIVEHVGNEADWASYAQVVSTMPDWPRFGCRSCQVTTWDAFSLVICERAGAVLKLTMPENDRVDAFPEARYEQMPLAMATIILRRALWPGAGIEKAAQARIQLSYRGERSVWLDQRGDWRAVI